jgi:nucleolar protein 58
LQLQHFQKFDDTTVALAAITGSIEGKIPKPLKKLMKKISDDAQETLLVADAKLGNSIKEKFNINCLSNNSVQDLMRLIRGQMDSLIKIPEKEIAAMRIGLAHRLAF